MGTPNTGKNEENGLAVANCQRDVTPSGDLEAAAWLGPDGPNSWFENGEAVTIKAGGERWVQYRLALGATNSCGTPRVDEVSVSYGVSET